MLQKLLKSSDLTDKHLSVSRAFNDIFVTSIFGSAKLIKIAFLF